MTYRAIALNGKWAVEVLDAKGKRKEIALSGVSRQAARTFAYRLRCKRVHLGRNDTLPIMASTGLPGHVLGAVIEQAKADAKYNFEKNKFAILAGIREAERQNDNCILIGGSK